MSMLSKENQRALLTAGAAMITGYVVKWALSAIWKQVSKNDPPQNPELTSVAWREALVWTVASSVAVGVAGLAVSRGVSSLIGEDDSSILG